MGVYYMVQECHQARLLFLEVHGDVNSGVGKVGALLEVPQDARLAQHPQQQRLGLVKQGHVAFAARHKCADAIQCGQQLRGAVGGQVAQRKAGREDDGVRRPGPARRRHKGRLVVLDAAVKLQQGESLLVLAVRAQDAGSVAVGKHVAQGDLGRPGDSRLERPCVMGRVPEPQRHVTQAVHHARLQLVEHAGRVLTRHRLLVQLLHQPGRHLHSQVCGEVFLSQKGKANFDQR
mmetsp:Transcript_1237/g.2955  ORF Transcript_1237/g.2955 Transcript_1237/m.2955 type:complete len:233 (+) Transcript_1237:16-714(+)